MRARKRLTIATLAVALIAVLPGTALAEDDTRSDNAQVDTVSDHPSDRAKDRPSDKPSDRKTDRCLQRAVDPRCVSFDPQQRAC